MNDGSKIPYLGSKLTDFVSQWLDGCRYRSQESFFGSPILLEDVLAKRDYLLSHCRYLPSHFLSQCRYIVSHRIDDQVDPAEQCRSRGNYSRSLLRRIPLLPPSRAPSQVGPDIVSSGV